MNAIYLSRELAPPEETEYREPAYAYQRTAVALDALEERINELMEINQPCDPSAYDNVGEAMGCIFDGDRKALVAAIRAENEPLIGKILLRVVKTWCEDKAQLMAWRGQ